ncbi:helix-turn-helix transcriptional regulator [Paraburkholderia sp. UCT31]|uniref:helix-turn-helix domain-containing protein n=1 Tax=Paraburkholderia sp. UCT31 TaxID=2615209 RepID=UPI00165505DD|nr:helix-turn-helix domain-containing protein [Paraburkholderia sp. UCT31]MBC8737359.1 helix-turn-helix transcriptional regulator [Paraburkholderia sp. UCT31]
MAITPPQITPVARNGRNAAVRIGNNVRAWRNKRGLTQLEVAAKAFDTETSHCRVSRVERGVHPDHSLNESVRAIAKVLRVPAKTLLA